MRMATYKDKVAVVIGATVGIGRATAEAFAAAGAAVFLTGRNEAVGEELVVLAAEVFVAVRMFLEPSSLREAGDR